MTKQEAMDEGFVYEGKFGLAKVYLTDLHACGHCNPGVAGTNRFWDIVLDIQEAMLFAKHTVMEFLKPGSTEGVGVFIQFGPRLDGKETKEGELE